MNDYWLVCIEKNLPTKKYLCSGKPHRLTIDVNFDERKRNGKYLTRILDERKRNGKYLTISPDERKRNGKYLTRILDGKSS